MHRAVRGLEKLDLVESLDWDCCWCPGGIDKSLGGRHCNWTRTMGLGRGTPGISTDGRGDRYPKSIAVEQ